MKRPMITFSLLILLCLVQIVYYSPKLPDPVASHFTLDGEANGWSSKTSFLIIYISSMVFLVLVFLGSPWLISVLPISLINMPNKAYWLAPERRAATLSFMSGKLLDLGSATLGLFILLLHLIFKANLSGEEPTMGNESWVVMGGYLGFTLIWTIHLFFRLRKPAGSG